MTQRLFSTSRGKILILLCRRRRTVGELAAALNLTPNAVRAQLERLQRDGLARLAGSRPGVRKPHADYEITSKARRLFPTAYEPLLQEVLNVANQQLPESAMRNLLDEVLRRLAQQHVGKLKAGDSRQRLSEFMKRIEPFAPGVALEVESDTPLLRACSCPLASVTASHPQLCQLVAGTLSGILGARVVEKCHRGERPRCHFEIASNGGKGSSS